MEIYLTSITLFLTLTSLVSLIAGAEQSNNWAVLVCTSRFWSVTQFH